MVARPLNFTSFGLSARERSYRFPLLTAIALIATLLVVMQAHEKTGGADVQRLTRVVLTIEKGRQFSLGDKTPCRELWASRSHRRLGRWSRAVRVKRIAGRISG
jgi:hypothetical protein